MMKIQSNSRSCHQHLYALQKASSNVNKTINEGANKNMSTRAIVGYKRTDGTIIGAWCWNDGYNVKDDLKRDFKSLLDVEFILEAGMFSTIFSKKEYEDFTKWATNENIDISEKIFTHYGKSIIMQDAHHIEEEPVEYKNIEEVLGQDINIAYIFENGEWKEYK